MPSINGYSGYYPPSTWIECTVSRSSRQIATTQLLRRAGVQYVIVHISAYREGEAGSVLMALTLDQNYVQLGRFHDGQGTAVVYRLR